MLSPPQNRATSVEPNEPKPLPSDQSREEKIVKDSIVKIQSFIRMIIARSRYQDIQTKRQEEELEQLIDDPDTPPISKTEPKTLQLQLPASSQGVKEKYMGQLTLEMIESESIINKRNSKAGTGQPSSAAIPGKKKSLNMIQDQESINEQDSENGTASRVQEEDVLQSSDVSFKLDWRQYFTQEELVEAFEDIQNGKDPCDKEEADNKSIDNGSESCPSEDNLELKELYNVMYCEKNKCKEAITAKNMQEEHFEKDFANFVKKIHRRYRDASKESAASGEPGYARHTHKNGETCDRCRGASQDGMRNQVLHLDQSLDRSEQDEKTKKGGKINLMITGKGQSIEPIDEEKEAGGGP